MPELPEVEVVRRGLEEHVVGRTIADAEFPGARVARRYLPGPVDLADRIRGARVEAAGRRGKYLWLVLDAQGEREALIIHLGMSGQLLVEEGDAPRQRHLHATLDFTDGGPQLRFVDQRTFGGVALAGLAGEGAAEVPETIRHIAPDPFDPVFDESAVIDRLKTRQSAIKRALLDQTLVSGIGNIYADEALWRAGVHGERLAAQLSRNALAAILGHARDVMSDALDVGGTSFDALYVNVSGASGFFDRSLAAYGQEGRPCPRCGTPIRREAFMNRSSYSCPRCQPRPRRRATASPPGTPRRPSPPQLPHPPRAPLPGAPSPAQP
jgi:formamidopyrimidine-DNA glycosylase